MSKKIMLVVLAVVSASFLVLPAMASAAELHVEGATGKTFTGAAGASTFAAVNEPPIQCSTGTESGSFTTETTGNVTLVFDTCYIPIAGLTFHCNSAGSATGIVTMTTSFHLITFSTLTTPGILLTPPFPTIICGTGATERKHQYVGTGVIGTITSPLCNASSNGLTLIFSAPGAIQEHKEYTGTLYDLSVTTSTGPHSTATGGLTGHTTWTFSNEAPRKLACT